MDMNATEKPMLILKDIHKFYGKNEVIKGVSLEVRRGELVTFVGPSGCGKTTLLRLIGGFTDISSGDIILDGQRINDLPPNLRDTRICFQNYALFPHMTVAENVGYGLKINKWPKDKINARVKELLEMVELEAFGDRMIDKLSGGQQQRVAFARALSLEPKVLLLDEPLSNLDANLRLVMREEIRKLQERLHITTVFVTHDQFEAMAISDRLVVMKNGLIEQVGSPIEIYERPANEFIAAFVGYVNFMDGRIESIDQATRDTVVATPYGKFEITSGTGRYPHRRRSPHGHSSGERYPLDGLSGAAGKNVLCGTLKTYMYAGSLAKCTVMIGDKKMIIDQYNPRDAKHFKHAEKVEVEIPRSVHLLKKR